jgi:mannitol-1-/sugar-/sorbitol-6-/2-deoxyglucose-6-phosphatase
MPPPFYAVIFDLDGVLADSEPWWNQIDAKLLAENGVSYRGEYHRNVLGVSYRLAVEFYKNAFHISASVEELMRRRGEIATDFFANRVGLFPSAKTTLEQLREMKLQLAVATSSVSASARPLLDRTGIRSLFGVVITGGEVQQGKPHPDIYLRTAQKLGTSSEACLGDRGRARRCRRGESREHACRRHSRHALCGSARVRKRSRLCTWKPVGNSGPHPSH